jgi:hypothetical protein
MRRLFHYPESQNVYIYYLGVLTRYSLYLFRFPSTTLRMTAKKDAAAIVNAIKFQKNTYSSRIKIRLLIN